MMRFLYVYLMLLYIPSFGQVISIDRANGNLVALKTGVTALKLIEQNKPDLLVKYFSIAYKPGSEWIENHCIYVSETFQYEENMSAPCFCKETKRGGYWYERTYYKKIDSQTDYQFQIYVRMMMVDKEIKIVGMEFRNKEKIQRIDKEIKELEKVDGSHPPPPPPPASLLEHN
jgi:hypothetical protein